ncbi:MAG: hypothetical protein DBP02_02180 [gamma proteobacterium symbiont of Ctena orbiculata]|nr:MAG: hypothetical protein DBP02_02180 [gamma proteobacterium symbiont of Ctena orbiculata]
MANLKRSKSERETLVGEASSEDELYPWGLRLHLEEPEIEKLGISEIDVGSILDISGKVKVTSYSKHEDDKESRRSIELQVTDLTLPAGEGLAERLYGKNK